MASQIILKNGQDQEFSITHPDNVGAVQINSNDIATKLDLDINSKEDKLTPVDTDNIAIQESGGLFKKLSFANLMNWIKSFSLGWGQTWQNVSANRIAGVTYTNNTGKPIEFNVSFHIISGSWSFQTTVDGIASGGGVYGSLTIPKGSTYSYTFTGNIGGIVVRELR